MIKSMTGFGRAQGVVRGIRIKAECRSVNSKGMDLNLRLPGIFREKEMEIRKLLSKKIERGKADISLYIEQSESKKLPRMDEKVIKAYHRQLSALPASIRGDRNNFLEQILRLQDVFKMEKDELKESDWKAINRLLLSSLDQLDRSRVREGSALSQDLKQRIKTIATALKKVEKLDQTRLKQMQVKLEKSVESKIDKSRLDQNRLEQELIYYLEKLDITEEKVRLKTHLEYFVQTMKEASSGKKLSFISQEIGREINTVGSKANFAPMQKVVVEMKDELEKIKEQLNNVL